MAQAMKCRRLNAEARIQFQATPRGTCGGQSGKETCFCRSKVWYRHPFLSINPYPTAFPYGNGMVLHFYQQQESSTTKTVHKVINKGLKTYV